MRHSALMIPNVTVVYCNHTLYCTFLERGEPLTTLIPYSG